MTVVGTGVGGLAVAVDLARQGCQVTLLERAATPGGKMREVIVGGRAIDAGPTVFTMRWVFESLFADAGVRLEDRLDLRPAEILARHAWSATERLDLFADPERSAEAIGGFAGPKAADGFRAFCRQAARTYATLETPFIKAPLPSMLTLARDVRSLRDLLAIRPFQTLWAALGEHLPDPRLRQLFARYATYCGSSPFLAPATLMLVAHVEQLGVWLVEGGMHRVATALAVLATEHGATIRYGAEVAEIVAAGGRASGVRLASGEVVEADAVVVNADPAALAAGLFGDKAAVTPALPRTARSLSALTWTGVAETSGFPLLRHTVFFSGDYKAEFDALAALSLPAEPTVYVCAQDREDGDAPAPGPERLLILVNAPAIGDMRDFTPTEIDQCRDRAFDLMQRCGLQIRPTSDLQATTPAGFHRLFPGTGGALYGPAVHGPTATFRRPGSRTGLRGLYLAGGSTHPGAGVPMAALSGRLAASAVMADLGSTRRSRPAAISGGMSTR